MPNGLDPDVIRLVRGGRQVAPLRITDVFRDPNAALREAFTGGAQTPRQRRPRTPTFATRRTRRAPRPEDLGGSGGALGLVSALTIGGIPGALGAAGVGGNPLSIRRPRNIRT